MGETGTARRRNLFPRFRRCQWHSRRTVAGGWSRLIDRYCVECRSASIFQKNNKEELARAANSRFAADRMQNATGSTLMAALMLLPVLPFTQAPSNLTFLVVGAIVAAGTLNTAVNFLLFYSLAHAVGPTPTLAINYVVPLNGILFSVILLGEPVPPSLLSGAVLALETIRMLPAATGGPGTAITFGKHD
ncbi:MAG: DMT family transporter, partial [Spongiibacteraceae bacterium]